MALVDIRRLMIGTIFAVVAIQAVIAGEHCRLHSLSIPYNGRYCPGDGKVTPHLLPHQCRYMCLQSNTCKAYNYNNSEGTCTQFTSPCPQAYPDNLMEFMVVPAKTMDQCCQWVPYTPNDPVGTRMISTDDPDRIICRMQKDGDDIVCYLGLRVSICYGSWRGSRIRSSHGYPCQLLRIVEDCTVFWVPYVGRDPINPRAVIAGRMANGDAVYVTKFDYSRPPMLSLAGHYVEGADLTYGSGGQAVQSSTTMMMLVML